MTYASLIRFNFQLGAQVLGTGAGIEVRAIVAADKASHMTSDLVQTFAPPDGSMHRFPATWPLERIVAALNELQPDQLTGYASMIQQLTREAAAGRLRIAPKLVGSTSEPLLPEIRAAVAATRQAPLFNGFGTTEGLMGGSCGASRGIHLSDDLFVIEPVDSSGDPLRPGERASKLYLTNLYNLTQPLVRYELTDEVAVLDAPCSCGTTLVRIDDIQGRLDDCFTYPDGPTIHPFTFRSPLGREANIVEYQVRQTLRGADVLVRCDGPVDMARVAETIRCSLIELGLSGATVSLGAVDALTRESTGKLRRFIPLPVDARRTGE